ncbi:uncharacterized protein LOC127713993 [Mytilus californianus]|uniref:uncharacterized protein LOC127713993 n=1 Tax=Mytilus californianus TaxID=6549 RepID=UPI002245EDF6|nr:uncharacterized protein LOC127713993 [Mytilus californianus]
MKYVKTFVNEDYEGLIIKNDMIRFGSSIDGLKVNDALEFDCILLFDIIGMIVSKELNYMINTVLIFFVVLQKKPPTFDINITLNKEKDITDLRDDIRLVQGVHVAIESDKKPGLDIDFFPAFHLRNDRVPNLYTEKLPHGFGIEQMNCQVYAVMKWVHRSTEASSTFDSDCLWRECTSGYEKQILDICRRNNSQRYLMTACRLLKSYVANQHKTIQIRSVAASQHLKTICFFCVTFLTTPSDHNSLSWLKEALGYFLFFLGLCIESKNLPHFFFGNPWLCTHFPKSSFGHGQKQKNLYSSVKWETFRQASLSYTNMLDDLKVYLVFIINPWN